MTFLEVQTGAAARVDEAIEDLDSDILGLLKDAVNAGYMLLAAHVDQKTKTVTMALDDYDNKLPLPSDFASLMIAEHENLGEIATTYYQVKGNILYFGDKTLNSGDVTLTYVYYPTKLVNDSDVVNLRDAFYGAITAYAAYVYMLYRKKYDAAQLLLQEFNNYMPQAQQVSGQTQ